METDLESWARKEIKKAGGRMLKFTSPGTRGPNDDIILWPRKVVQFAEFKYGRGPTAKLQSEFHKMLEGYGHQVWLPRERADVRDMMAWGLGDGLD
jgi:hypothetical protein